MGTTVPTRCIVMFTVGAIFLTPKIGIIGLGVGVDVHVDVLAHVPAQVFGRDRIGHEFVGLLRIGHLTRHQCDAVLREVLTRDTPRFGDGSVVEGTSKGRHAVLTGRKGVDRVRRLADVSYELESRRVSDVMFGAKTDIVNRRDSCWPGTCCMRTGFDGLRPPTPVRARQWCPPEERS